MKGFFDFAREEHFPTQFPSEKTAVTVDVLETGFILAFVMLVICVYIIIPGFRGKYQIAIFVRVTVSLLIGALLMISNFGQEWEVGDVTSRTPYKAGQPHEISATIGVKIGLRSVNVTLLRTEEDKSHEELKGEKIDYNERFWWTWDQGRFGFGPYAGVLQQSFRQAQLRGLPLPILWVVDYFTVDGEGLRYGRHYRTAGWYAHIAMWAALPCWMLANFLFLSIIRYAAYFTMLTGALQLMACILWATIRNPVDLEIPFENGTIITQYGSSFYCALISGIICVLIGLLLLFLDLRFPDEIAVFFGIDPLANYEEYHLTTSELAVLRREYKSSDIGMEELISPKNEPIAPKTQYVLKRRTSVRVAQKSLFRSTPAITVTAEDDDDDEAPLYLNVPRSGNYTIQEEEITGSHQNLYEA